MKKILLSCFLALGIGANAQFSQNFDAGTTMPTGWSVIAGGDANSFTIINAAANAHSGTNVAGIIYGSTAHNDYLVTPAIVVAAGVNDRLSFWAKSQDPLYLENYSVKISTTTNTPATAFTTTIKASSAAPGTWTQYFIDLRTYVGQTVYLGFNATSTDQFRLYFDDVVSDPYPLTAPSCTTISAPTNGSTVSAGTATMTWAAASGATGYKVSVGTTSGGTDVYNATISGTTTTVSLPVSSTLYAKVVPTNANGDATGCTGITFSTNSTLAYCIPTVTASDHTSFEKISKVVFSNVSNSSTSTAGYEDFTSTTANVVRESSYPITVTISSFDTDLTNAWIDYNQDGTFADSEKVALSSTASATGSITIPASAKLGTTRMRVRTSYAVDPSACGSTSYGQAEDYSVNITAPTMAVSDVNKASISVYPNPFTDVLKISDVKGVKSISVNDISGRQVKTLETSAELNLSSLKSGLYIVNLQMEDGSVKSFKAIKK